MEIPTVAAPTHEYTCQFWVYFHQNKVLLSTHWEAILINITSSRCPLSPWRFFVFCLQKKDISPTSKCALCDLGSRLSRRYVHQNERVMSKNNRLNIWILNNPKIWGTHLKRREVVMDSWNCLQLCLKWHKHELWWFYWYFNFCSDLLFILVCRRVLGFWITVPFQLTDLFK